VVIVVVVIIALFLIVALVDYEFFAPPTSPVQISEVDIWAPNNVCGLNSNQIAYTGYNTSTNSNDSFDLGVPNFNSTACTIMTVSTNTSGFAITSVQVPLTLPGNVQNASMNITIESPGTSYSGSLNLVFE
jgi:hypothetical protein